MSTSLLQFSAQVFAFEIYCKHKSPACQCSFAHSTVHNFLLKHIRWNLIHFKKRDGELQDSVANCVSYAVSCQCIMQLNWFLVKCKHRIACRMQKSMLLSFLFSFRIGITWWKEMLNIGRFCSLRIFFSPEIHKIT